ncbi:phage late control D family protein [Corallococcus sp. AS-1-6]|uniref:phage late control D family protein n=1 Tax=Corallococcus sp. AS-1-6 TaxID=2874599 RepID=UPI001CC1B593|nr:hypothetical protein [Corallococcus sp. AS-1-6]MBZ4373781.1 hypothetical protein [Corallococcus sp. AS-1-6]
MADPTPFISVLWQGGEIGGMVQSVNVEDHDRLIDRVRIVVDDPREIAGHIVDVGQTLKVDLGWSDDHAVIFEGVVTRAVPEVTGGRRRVTLTALDFSVRLRRHERPSEDPPYRGKLSEIIRTIVSAQDYGFVVSPDNIKPDPDPEYTEDNELPRRSGINDWDFLQQLAMEHDCRAFVEYNEGASKFYFVPTRTLLNGEPMGKLHQCPGFTELLDFRYQRIASGAAPAYTTSTVDPSTGQAVSTHATPPDPVAPPSASADVRSRLSEVSDSDAMAYDAGIEAAGRATRSPTDQVPQLFLPGLPSDPALAERLVRRDPTRVLGLVGEGTARGTVRFRAKGRLTLEGISAWAEGDWYVARVNHVFTRTSSAREPFSGTYRTRFVATR